MKLARQFHVLFVAAACCWMGAVLDPLAAAEAKRPNVIVFLADDAGWGDYGASGNKQVRTPNIDSLAADGASLDRFYVCPVCSPTRAEFLTGRYHPRGGVYGTSLGQERLDLDERTVAEAFQRAGYATGCFGKWHNGSQWPYHPQARGFDEFFGYTAGHWGEYFDPPLEENGRLVRTKGYIVDICTERAINFIDRNGKKPFFCYVPFTTPHSPWGVPEEDWQKFKDAPITQTNVDPTKEKTDETRCVWAMLANQDRNVGRVLAKLDELKLRDDTIVVYFSDNGPNTPRWTGGMKGRKGSIDEGGVRSVCFWRWPGKFPAGHMVPQISGAIDLLPTLTGLCGIERVGDKPLDGRDISPLLLGKNTTGVPDRMIFSTRNGLVSVRTQRHRLDERGQLFGMVADPGQTKPRNDVDSQTTAELTAAAKAWREEVFDQEVKVTRGVDPRPLPVGYEEFPITMLPARDGTPSGGVERSSGAPNSSYFVNWTTTDGRMEWSLDVHTAGRYRATIDYTCPEADAGSTIELSAGEHRLQGAVAPGWDPPLYTNQDTLPRPQSESRMKEFRPLELGELTLDKGRATLVLKAIKIPGKSVMDVRRVTLTLLD
jgi:arylsulfatase A-like enzyme